MKGQGTFRRIADSFKKFTGRPTTKQMPDPVLKDPRDRQKKRGTGSGAGPKLTVGRQRRMRTVPPCRPGSISYHDKMVRHFGRRKADKLGRLMQASKMELWPTAEDFAANPPWAFLKSTGTG